MTDIVERIILDNSDYVKGMEDVIAVNKKAGEEFNDVVDVVEKGQKKIANEVKKTSDTANKSIIRNVTELRKQREELTQNIKSQEFFGVSINKVQTFLKSNIALLNNYRKTIGLTTKITERQAKGVRTLTNVLGGGQKGFILMARGANVMKAALISTGVGALVVALGGLVAWLTKSQEGMDFLSRKLASGQAIVNKVTDLFIGLGGGIKESFDQGTLLEDFWEGLKKNVLNRITAVGESFGKLGDLMKNVFSGNFSEAKKDMTDLVALGAQFVTGIDDEKIKNFGKELATTSKEAENTKGNLQAITREAARLEVETAKSRAQIKLLNKDAEDVNKTYKERGQAAAQAYGIEQELLKKRIDNQQRLVNAIIAQNSLSTSTDEDLQKQYDAEIALANLKAESLEQQTTIQNKLNAIRDQEEAAIQKQEGLLTSLQKTLIETFDRLAKTESEEEFNIVKQDQIKNLVSFRRELEKISTALEVDSSDTLNIIDEAVSKLEGTTVRALESIAEIGDKSYENIDKGLESTTDNTVENVEKATQEAKSKLEEWNTFLDKSSEKINSTLENIVNFPAIEGFTEFISGLGALLSESLQRQIDANQELIDQRESQIKGLEDELKREEELREDGLANNVNLKKREYEQLLAEQEKDQAKQQALRDKAAKAQAAQDNIAQGQALLTSSINIIRGFSQIPFVGLPLGIAAVGTLLAFFAKTKIDAARATKLSTGADRIDDYFGYADKYGDTDLGPGKGYNVINARTGKDTGVIISGKEMIIPEDTSKEYDWLWPMLKQKNLKKFDFANLVKGQKGKSDIIVNNPAPKPQKNKQFVPFTDKKGRQGVIVKDASKMADGDIIYIE